MQQETIVVYLDPAIDNFKCLGDVFNLKSTTRNVKVVFTKKLNVMCDGNELLANADYFIYGPHDQNYRTIRNVFNNKAIFINRLDKNEQAWNLLKIMGVIPNTKAIPTFWIGNGGPKFCPSGCDLVIKPANGARGIGQFVLNGRDLAKWTTAHRRYQDNYFKVEEFLDEVKGYSTHYPGKEIYENESIETLKHDPLFIQKKLDNIKAEFRALTGHNGSLEYLQYRERTGDQYKQASGSSGADNDVVYDAMLGFSSEYSKYVTNKLFLAMSKVAKHIGSYQSIDFGITDDNELVVFEYCNQFGLDGVPYLVAERIHSDAIKRLINFVDDVPEVVKNEA